MRQTYVIQSVNGGPIKIGIADDPVRRLKQLQTAHPEQLRLLRVWNDEGLEAELHQTYAAKRLRGEWFDESVLPLLKGGERSLGECADCAGSFIVYPGHHAAGVTLCVSCEILREIAWDSQPVVATGLLLEPQDDLDLVWNLYA